MEARTVEINLISARDLKDVNVFSKTKAYAVAWINGDPRRDKHRTAVDKENGTNPNWNQSMSFTVDEGLLQQGRLVLEFEIRCEGTFGDKDLGRVTIPLKEFAIQKANKAGNGAEFVSYQVRRSSGKAKGTLNLSIKLGGKAEIQQPQYQPTPYQYPAQGPYAATGGASAKNTNEPVTAYPAGYPAYPPPNPSSSSYQPPPPPGGPYPPPGGQYPPQPYPPSGGQYPPPQHQQGGYPPYQGYPPSYQGYPPSYQGYPPSYQGYPPVVAPPQQQKPPKKNKMGMGLGAGLLGGALGGLLIGDMIGDASSYDDGYDAGFDDGGDFGGGDF